MSLRDKLNQFAKKTGNSIVDGLGDILTTDVNPKYLLSAAVLAGGLALGWNVYAQDVQKTNHAFYDKDGKVIKGCSWDKEGRYKGLPEHKDFCKDKNKPNHKSVLEMYRDKK